MQRMDDMRITNKHYIIHQEQDTTLVIQEQDWKLKPKEKDFL